MKIHLTVAAEVDEEASAEHVAGDPSGAKYPLVADPSEWTWDDFVGAVGEEIATDVEIVDFTIVG